MLILYNMQSYQLFIYLSQNTSLLIGKLGFFNFPKGTYIYTGSAKKNLDARVKRHFVKEKKLHWHIDYFLNNKKAEIIEVIKSKFDECNLNQSFNGKIIAKGFGSSDCKQFCVSHLKYSL